MKKSNSSWDRIKETTDFDWDDVAESIRQTKGIERLEWNDKKQSGHTS